MAELNYTGKAGNDKQHNDKIERMEKVLDMLKRNASITRIAETVGLSYRTVIRYQRELIASGKLELCENERYAFIRQNRSRGPHWLAEKCGVSTRTIYADMRHLFGKSRDARQESKNGELAKEFVDCPKWRSVFNAMTTKQQVTL